MKILKKFEIKKLILFLFVVVTVIWGAGFSIMKMTINHGAPELFINASRFSIAAVVLFLIRLFKKKTAKFSEKDIIRGSVLGVLLFFAFSLQSFGIGLTSPAKSGMLTDSFVIMVPILLIFFNRKFSLKPLTDAAICLFGIMVFFNVFEDKSSFSTGEWLVVACALAFSLHIIFTEIFAKKSGVLELTVIQMTVCAVLSITSSLIFERGSYNQIDFSFVAGAVVFLGLFSTAFAFFVQTLAQKHFSSVVISLISCLEAVFATAISVMLGFETVTPMYVIGTFFILFSLLRSVLAKENYDRFLYL